MAIRFSNGFCIGSCTSFGSSGFQWMTINSVTDSTASGIGQNGITVAVTQSGGGMGATDGVFNPTAFPEQYGVPFTGNQIQNNNNGTFTATFSQPITDALVAFASIGNDQLSVPIEVSAPFTPIFGSSVSYQNPVNGTQYTQLTGNEGYAIIRIDGTVTTVTFNYTVAEGYCNVCFGFVNQNNLPTPTPTGTSIPATPTPTATAGSPTSTPNPSATPNPTPTSTPNPSATPNPTPTATSAPNPTATAGSPTPTPTATPTNTPNPSSTPNPTSTPVPTASSTPAPTASSTPVPTESSTPNPTATLTPTPTATTATGFTINIYESGSDVIWSGSGTLNTDALTLNGTQAITAGANNAQAIFIIGNGTPPGDTLDIYSGITTYTSSIGTLGSPGGSLVGSGSSFGILSNGTNRNLLVPTGYTSNSFISGSTTWTNSTLSGLGLTPGTYTWSWGSGATAGLITMIVGVAVTPTPTSTGPTATPTSTSGGGGSNSWYFYTPFGNNLTAPPLSNGQVLFYTNAGGPPVSVSNPNNSSGQVYLTFYKNDSTGTSYETQFGNLVATGGTINVTQNGQTATYSSNTPGVFFLDNSGFLVFNASIQTVTVANPFNYTDPISITFGS